MKIKQFVAIVLILAVLFLTALLLRRDSSWDSTVLDRFPFTLHAKGFRAVFFAVSLDAQLVRDNAGTAAMFGLRAVDGSVVPRFNVAKLASRYIIATLVRHVSVARHTSHRVTRVGRALETSTSTCRQTKRCLCPVAFFEPTNCFCSR